MSTEISFQFLVSFVNGERQQQKQDRQKVEIKAGRCLINHSLTSHKEAARNQK
jgi:hypothetical protein